MSDHVWVQENLEAYLASDLNTDEAEKVESHAAACGACEQELAEARHFGGVMDRLFSGARPDANLEARMIERVRSEEPRPRRRPTMWRFFAAAAAVMLLGVVGAIVQAVAMKGPSPFAGLRGLGFMGERKESAPNKMLIGLAPHNYHAPTRTGVLSDTVVEEGEKVLDEVAKKLKDKGIEEHHARDGINGRDGTVGKDGRDGKDTSMGPLRGWDSNSGSVVDALIEAHKKLPAISERTPDDPKGPMMGNMPGMSIHGMGMGGMGMGGMPGMGKPAPTSPREVNEKGKNPLLLEITRGRPFYGDSTAKFDEAGKEVRGYYDRQFAQRGDAKKGELQEITKQEKAEEQKDAMELLRKPSRNGDNGGKDDATGKDLFTPPTPVLAAPPSQTYFKPPMATSPPPGSTTAAKPGDPAAGAEGDKQPGQLVPKKVPNALEPPAEQPPLDMGRKIIRTGDMEFEIESFYSTIDTIGGLLKKIAKGTGFVATTNSDKLPNGKMRGSIVVRMPPQYLDDFLKELRDALTKTGELKSQRIGSQDVTKAYTDTESELRAARAVEGRLIEIIKTGKGEIKDLIAAERELGVWRTKIEKMEGELRYYNNQVSLSTVTILLYEKEIQAPSAIVITERIGMRLEVDDVALAHEAALKAVVEAKGRVTRSELKQHSALQLEAILHVEIAPAAKETFSAQLKKLGIVSHHDTQRLQQSEGGTGRPLDLKLKQSDVRFEIAIHDVVNVRPKHTASIQVAVVDVVEQFNKLREEIIRLNGQIRVDVLSEQDKLNITGQLEFNVKSADKAVIDKSIAAFGTVLSRTNIQAPVTELSTDRKQGYSLTFRDFASIPPRQAVSLQLATPDVPTEYLRLQMAIRALKGYVRTSQLNEQDRSNISANLDFSVMSADKPAIDTLLAKVGAVLSRNNLEAPMGGLATEQKFGFSVVLRDLASIPPRYSVNRQIATPDVPAFYERVLAAVRAAKGHVRVNQLNEQDKNNITAHLDFSVMTADKAAIDDLLDSKPAEGAVVTVLSRHNVEAPAGAQATELKFGYTVLLRDFNNIPPSKATELTIAANDVAGNYAKLLKVIAQAKGQVGENKLNEQDKLNITALVRFMIPSGEKPALDEILGAMGTVLSRNNVQAPVSELSTDRKFGYSVVLRDIASIPPRETFTLQIASLDVQANFRELQEAVAQVKGLVHVAQVAEDSKVNIAARFDFNVAAVDRLALEKAIAKAGAALTRTSSQVPANELATDQKVGYQLTLRSTANIPPRDKVNIKLEVKDVDTRVAELKEIVRGRLVDSTVERQENSRVAAVLVFEVPLASQDVVIRQIKGNETPVSQKTVRNQQVPENELATAQITVILNGTVPIGLPPNDEGIVSYINRSLYVAFVIFANCVMVIIIGISAILPWALIGVVGYWVYSRMNSPTIDRRIEVKPAPKPAAAPAPDAGQTGNQPPAAMS